MSPALAPSVDAGARREELSFHMLYHLEEGRYRLENKIRRDEEVSVGEARSRKSAAAGEEIELRSGDVEEVRYAMKLLRGRGSRESWDL